MVLIAQYLESNLTGFQSDKGDFYPIEYEAELKALGHTLEYKSQILLDIDLLNEAKNKKISTIKQDFELVVNAMAGDVAKFEDASWKIQEDEARAFMANGTFGPMLEALLSTRAVQNETLTILSNLIIANADAYKVAYGSALGVFQGKIKRINDAKTILELEAI